MMVPGISLGFNTTLDPANSMFTGGANGNFRDASAGQLTDARQLYAILTGRVTAVTGQAALDPDTGQYSFLGARRRAGNMNEYSLFLQDSWRATPALTINAGLRWDLQMPFTPVNDVMTTVTLADICGVSGLGSGGTYDKCNFYAPGATGGKFPEFSQFKKGNLGYDTDWNNIAPNVGVAWRPNVQGGWLRGLLGDPDQATLRAGYSIAYERQGMAVFTGQFGPNPGSTLSLTRNNSTGLGQGSDAPWPVLLRQPERLYNQPFPETPTFPDSGQAEPRRQHRRLRARHRHRVRAVVDDRVPACAVARHRDGDPLCRDARRRPVVRIELQRAERHRERVLRRVQARDDEPEGQQRLGDHEPGGLVRLLRPGHRHQSAPDLPRLPQREPERDRSQRLHGGNQHLDELDPRAAARRDESRT